MESRITMQRRVVLHMRDYEKHERVCFIVDRILAFTPDDTGCELQYQLSPNVPPARFLVQESFDEICDLIVLG